MNTLQEIFNSLAIETPLAENLNSPINQPLKISQPIDTGAVALLQPFVNAYVTYPPLEVDYLVKTLNQHIANCLELRMKAQDLEVRAFVEASDQLLQRYLLESLQRQANLFALNEPRILANTINTRLMNGTVQGDAITYWNDILTEKIVQITKQIEDADKRLKMLTQNGSGTNFVERFEFLKKLFEIELIEAYCRASTANIGLKKIYNIDIPMPQIVDVGYLNELTIWTRKITYELEKKFFDIRETTVAFALNDYSTGAAAIAPPVYDLPRILTKDAYERGLAQGNFTFTLTEDMFTRLNQRLKNPRLRGIDVHATKSAPPPLQPDYWRIFLKAPIQRISIGVGIPDYTYEPAVHVPMATYPLYMNDNNLSENLEEVYNVTPIGDWIMKIEKKNIKNGDTSYLNVENLIIKMRITYERI